LRGDVPPDVLAAVGVLGPICIYGRDGRLSVRGGKQQRLLAVLSAAHGRTVSTDQLIDTLWGAAPPSSAPTALRVHVARLRDILTAASAPAPRLVHRPPGYALEIAAERIDAMQFTSLVSAPVDVDPEVSLVRLERALALWRGDPYGGLSDSDLLRMEARRLSELYEEALEDRAEALLLLGEHHQAAVRAGRTGTVRPPARASLEAADDRAVPRRSSGRRARGLPPPAAIARP
jgi:DNA-binding SARP family transcriptional activator